MSRSRKHLLDNSADISDDRSSKIHRPNYNALPSLPSPYLVESPSLPFLYLVDDWSLKAVKHVKAHPPTLYDGCFIGAVVVQLLHCCPILTEFMLALVVEYGATVPKPLKKPGYTPYWDSDSCKGNAIEADVTGLEYLGRLIAWCCSHSWTPGTGGGNAGLGRVDNTEGETAANNTARTLALEEASCALELAVHAQLLLPVAWTIVPFADWACEYLVGNCPYTYRALSAIRKASVSVDPSPAAELRRVLSHESRLVNVQHGNQYDGLWGWAYAVSQSIRNGNVHVLEELHHWICFKWMADILITLLNVEQSSPTFVPSSLTNGQQSLIATMVWCASRWKIPSYELSRRWSCRGPLASQFVKAVRRMEGVEDKDDHDQL